jgi:hypothetical protein
LAFRPEPRRLPLARLPEKLPSRFCAALGLALAFEDPVLRSLRLPSPVCGLRSRFAAFLPAGLFPFDAPSPASLPSQPLSKRCLRCARLAIGARVSNLGPFRLRRFDGLDGFLLARPGGLFQPLTPLGFRFPFPGLVAWRPLLAAARGDPLGPGVGLRRLATRLATPFPLA